MISHYFLNSCQKITKSAGVGGFTIVGVGTERKTGILLIINPRIPVRRLFVISFGHSYRWWVCIIIY